MVDFGPLAAEIGLPVCCTPANLNGFRVLAALLHGSQVMGVSQALRRLTEDATHLCSAGRPSRWALVHTLVVHMPYRLSFDEMAELDRVGLINFVS